MNQAKPENVLLYLKKAHDTVVPLAEKVFFDKGHALHRTSMALYSSIIELSGTCCLLVDSKHATAVPILVRAILEAYVDLSNLLKNPPYGYHLEAAYLKEWLKILEEAKNGKNEYLSDISAAPTLDDTLKKWREKKNKLKAKGYDALTMETKFRRADLEKEYRSIYVSLCSHAHNNISALISRHFEREEGDFSMVLYKAYTLEDSAINIGITAELLVRASEAIHDHFRTDVQPQIHELRRELNHLRGDGAAAA